VQEVDFPFVNCICSGWEAEVGFKKIFVIIFVSGNSIYCDSIQ